jgi:hypothetical protein
MPVGASYAAKTAKVFEGLSGSIAKGASEAVGKLNNTIPMKPRPSSGSMAQRMSSMFPKRGTSTGTSLARSSDYVRAYRGGSKYTEQAMRSTGEFFAGNTGSKLAAGGILAAPVVAGGVTAGATVNSMRPSKLKQNREKNKQRKLARSQKYQEENTLGRIGMNTASVGKSIGSHVAQEGAFMVGVAGIGYAGSKYAKMFKHFA